MARKVEKLAEEIRVLPDIEKLQLVDEILTDLDKPDPEIDRVWADEARKRSDAFKAGRVPTVSYEAVMAKHRRPRRLPFFLRRRRNWTMRSHGTTSRRRDWAWSFSTSWTGR